MAPDGGPTERDLAGYLSALRRRWRWLCVPLVAVPLLAFFYTVSQPAVYESDARVLLDTSAAQEAVAGRLNLQTDVADRDLVNEANVADSDAVRALVRERLSIPAGELLPEGRITADLESDVLIFRFEGPTRERAAAIANTWADSYVDFKRESARASIDEVIAKLEDELAVLREQRAELRDGLEDLEDRLIVERDPEARTLLQLRVDREASAISGDVALVDAQITTAVDDIGQLQLSRELAGSASVVQEAELPLESSNGQVSRNLAIGLVLGAILGFGLALVVDSLDNSVRTSADLERLGLGITPIGRIPAVPRSLVRRELGTIAHTRPGSKYADGYHKVRTALQFLALERKASTILITSPADGDGKSTVVSNLALAYANADSSVVLIDADLRRPRVHQILATQPAPGLADLGPGRSSLENFMVGVPQLTPHLRVVPAGAQPPANPAAFLGSPLVASAIRDLGRRADVVLIDAPPVLPVADALSLAPLVDGVIVVVNAGSTDESDLVEAIGNLRRAGGNVLGTILNGVRVNASSRYHRNTRRATPLPDGSPSNAHPTLAPDAAVSVDATSAAAAKPATTEEEQSEDPAALTTTVKVSPDFVKRASAAYQERAGNGADDRSTNGTAGTGGNGSSQNGKHGATGPAPQAGPPPSPTSAPTATSTPASTVGSPPRSPKLAPPPTTASRTPAPIGPSTTSPSTSGPSTTGPSTTSPGAAPPSPGQPSPPPTAPDGSPSGTEGRDATTQLSTSDAAGRSRSSNAANTADGAQGKDEELLHLLDELFDEEV